MKLVFKIRYRWNHHKHKAFGVPSEDRRIEDWMYYQVLEDALAHDKVLVVSDLGMKRLLSFKLRNRLSEAEWIKIHRNLDRIMILPSVNPRGHGSVYVAFRAKWNYIEWLDEYNCKVENGFYIQ
jgi:hypothetical protein